MQNGLFGFTRGDGQLVVAISERPAPEGLADIRRHRLRGGYDLGFEQKVAPTWARLVKHRDDGDGHLLGRLEYSKSAKAHAATCACGEHRLSPIHASRNHATALRLAPSSSRAPAPAPESPFVAPRDSALLGTPRP